MKAVLAILVLVLIAVLLYADSRWRKWMAERRGERDRGDAQHHDPRA